ncbi:lethal (3) malignant blood neoplasm isoform X2 [Lycorma delicatula]|uniref:lethal (3) malignant blood neoplasm isoform X2 n=1 Tax=Lycorma delicatula TaxID=130591 RepID=UPI003F51850F
MYCPKWTTLAGHNFSFMNEKGIIKGEFGFVTGDGVYHVTEYATDENGGFRILSMKNFYIGLPNEGMTTAPSVAPSTTIKPNMRLSISGIQGCSGCLIPTTTAATKTNINEKTKGQNLNNQPQKNNISPVLYMMSKLNDIKPNENPKITKLMSIQKMGLNDIQKTISTSRNPQMGINTKFTDPEKPNINKEISSSDPSGLLYEFNQTQTFQGHHEKGFIDNSKTGDYFVNGRDGIQQIVEYIANESGYQPYIRFQNLSSSDTPDPKTEKIKNMLKGVYFRWFHKS